MLIQLLIYSIGASKPSPTDRLTGADKKNRDQKRHGATRGGKDSGDSNKKHGGFDRKSGNPRSGGQSKQGRGNHGFGNEADEARNAEKNGIADADADVDAEVEDVAEPVEPEAPSLSMEDFLAQRAETANNLTKMTGGAKAVRQVKADGETKGKATIGILLDSTVAAKEQGPKGLSKRLQAKQVVDVSYGFNLGNQGQDREDRPPRRDFNKEGGDRPQRERKPRDGDRPRRDNRDGKKGDDRRNNSKQSRGIDLKNSNAFPSL